MKSTEITNENLQWYEEQPVETLLELFKHYANMAKILAKHNLNYGWQIIGYFFIVTLVLYH